MTPRGAHTLRLHQLAVAQVGELLIETLGLDSDAPIVGATLKKGEVRGDEGAKATLGVVAALGRAQLILESAHLGEVHVALACHRLELGAQCSHLLLARPPCALPLLELRVPPL